MAKVPWFGAGEESKRMREAAATSLSKLKRPLPTDAKGPSTLQALAARRTSKLYYENIDDPRYKKNLYGERTTSSGGLLNAVSMPNEITWTLPALEHALALDNKIREATGATISPEEAESRKKWRTPIQR